jgi:DNA mismatch repair protein MutH
MNYQPDNLKSILEYSKNLIDKSLRDVCGEDLLSNTYKGKGNFGQLLEKYFYGYNPNSKSVADFDKIGMELKTSPLKIINKNKFRSKERLVLNIINYLDIHSENFEESTFLKKNYHILMIFYLYQLEVDVIDYIVKIVGDWKIPSVDLEIIKRDWESICEKIRDGRAHEISEGDTIYLGACTKGSKGGNFRPQPFSQIRAKQRAFSFKQGYLNHIIASLSNYKNDYGKLISSPHELRKKSFEQIVVDKFNPYLGKSIEEIVQGLSEKTFNPDSKNFFSNVTKHILGIELNQEIEEFEKAGIIVKTIRLKSNGLPKEDVSFPNFSFLEITNQDWEDSDFKDIVESKFLFVFYRYGKDNSLYLDKVKFWNMSFKEINESQRVWEFTKEIINQGNIVNRIKDGKRYTNFPSKKFSNVSHVRPHALNSKDTYPLPFKDKVSGLSEYTKHCFWLNNSFIRDNIYLND